EEVAITHHLPGTVPLTVILDGLDEAGDVGSVKRALTCWLKSRLGQASILIVSSRPEFWKLCSDLSWGRWMPTAADQCSPASAVRRSSMERRDAVDGVRVPDQFSHDELEASWLRAGQTREQLYALPSEAREELRHPFTLRAYLDLGLHGEAPQRPTTRVALME